MPSNPSVARGTFSGKHSTPTNPFRFCSVLEALAVLAGKVVPRPGCGPIRFPGEDTHKSLQPTREGRHTGAAALVLSLVAFVATLALSRYHGEWRLL